MPLTVPHPIPYQGSKRRISRQILSFFPQDLFKLVEPFAGSAAMTIAAAAQRKAEIFHLNDANGPLMRLWQCIVDDPVSIALDYRELWNRQIGQERAFYNATREAFNRTHEPACLLYLLARCVKASVRYNANGAFNQSPDNRRSGRHPDLMSRDIMAVSRLLSQRIIITNCDYLELLTDVSPTDLIYMDPPYQGVCGTGDQRYSGSIDHDDFVSCLSELVHRDISFILSYDGRTDNKEYGRPLPTNLGLCHLELSAGRSSQSTLLGRHAITYESLYLSPALSARIRRQVVGRLIDAPDNLLRQPVLFEA